MNSARVTGGSPERFGYEWARYAEIKAEYETQFHRWMPFFKQEEWRGATFVDVGCGMGRNSYWPLRYGAAKGYSVDVDDRTLASAKRNLAEYPNSEVLKMSAYDLPWENHIDIAYSIGVIHHLEFPLKALEAMARAVKPGGKVAIWVYGRENNGWLLWMLNPTRLALFSRLPIGLVHHLSLYPTALIWPVIKLGLVKLEYFQLLRRFDFAHLRSIVFDQMLPRIAHYWRKDEVRALLERAGLEDIQLVWVNEMSWAACGSKPTSPQAPNPDRNRGWP